MGGHGKGSGISGFNAAIRKQKGIISSLDREIAEIKSFAKKESQSGKLPSFYERDTPELRKDYEKILLKTNRLQSKIAQRTHAKKQLLRLEKIKKSLSEK